MQRHVLPAALAAVLPTDPGRNSARILSHGSFEARWLAPGGAASDWPRPRPEVFVVVRGRGTFFCDGTRESFGPGDMIWVPAGAEHRFEDFTRNLAVWAITYAPDAGRQGVSPG